MEQMLICLSIALIAGLLMSRLAKAVNLPAVTSYLVAGLLLGPFVLGRLGLSGLGIGFGSLEQVEGYGVVTQVALGFIAFVIGNEFRLSSLRSMGQQAITVGIAQAVITTAWWTWPGGGASAVPPGAVPGVRYYLGLHCRSHGPGCHPDGGQAV